MKNLHNSFRNLLCGFALVLSFLSGMVHQVNAQTSNLVNYDYPYTTNAYNTTHLNSISWNNFPEFHLPSKYHLVWFPGFSWSGLDWTAPLKRGFTHTQTWVNELGYTHQIGLSPIDSWQSPRKKRYLEMQTVAFTFNSGFEGYTNQAAHDEAVQRYKYVIMEGGDLSYNPNRNPPIPSTPPLPYSFQNQQNLRAWFVDSAGTLIKNMDMVGIDFELVYNLERAYSNVDANTGLLVASGINSFLACVQNPNCNSNESIPGFTASAERNGMPVSYQSLPFADFKKQWYKAKIKSYYAVLEAFNQIPVVDKPLIGNYSTNLEEPDKFGDTTYTWQQAISDVSFTNMMYRDTTNFTQFGNHLLDGYDHIGVNSYTDGGWSGSYSQNSGRWLKFILKDIEFAKAWAPNKPVVPWYWMKDDRYNSDPTLTWALKDPAYCEGNAIFSIVAGADGFHIWDIMGNDHNQHHYEYIIKGLHRLSHFNHILQDPNAIHFVPAGQDFFSIFKKDAKGMTDIPIWRGMVSGDSILVAAMNPYAPSPTTQTQVTVSYNGWSQTITLTGRQIFLGTARWNSGTVGGCSMVSNNLNMGTWTATGDPLVARYFHGQYWLTQKIGSNPDRFIVRGAGMLQRSDVTLNNSAYYNLDSCFSWASSSNGNLQVPNSSQFPTPSGYTMLTGQDGTTYYTTDPCSLISNNLNMGTWTATGDALVARYFHGQYWLTQRIGSSPDKFIVRGAGMLQRADVTLANSNYAGLANCFSWASSGNSNLQVPNSSQFPTPSGYTMLTGQDGVTYYTADQCSAISDNLTMGTWTITGDALIARYFHGQYWLTQKIGSNPDRFVVRGAGMLQRADVTLANSNYSNLVNCFSWPSSNYDNLEVPSSTVFPTPAGYSLLYYQDGTPYYSAGQCAALSDNLTMGTWTVTGEALVARYFHGQYWLTQRISSNPDKFVVRGAGMLQRSDVTLANSTYANLVNCFSWPSSNYDNLEVPSSTVFPTPSGYNQLNWSDGTPYFSNESLPPGSIVSGNCYNIKSVVNNNYLQATSGGGVEINAANNQNDQKWKLESVGSSYKITSMDGTGRVIKANTVTYSSFMVLGTFVSGNNYYYWNFENNSGSYRVSAPSNQNTWDHESAGTANRLQIYGNLSDQVEDYRLFTFESTSCPSGLRIAYETSRTFEEKVEFMNVAPNPTSGVIKVKVNLIESGEVNVGLTDMTGREIKSQTHSGIKGSNIFDFDASNYQTGTYLLRVKTNDKTESKKVVIYKD